MSQAATLTLDHDDAPILKALKRQRGRVTVGDVSSETGLAQAEAEARLRRLLEQRQGHLEVGERGDLVFAFDPRLLERGHVPLWTRVKRAAWSGFKLAFKIWIVAMLVVYLVVFVALMIAALFANRDGEGGGWGGGERGGGGRGGHAHFPLGDMLFWYWIWSPGWRHRPYYGEGYGRRGRMERGRRREGPPFYKKVFAFVFGPDEPALSQEQKDRELLRFVRARRGVVTAAELVQHTGMGLDEAESELGRLMAAHEGDVKVSDDGTLLYLFPGLLLSARGAVRVKEPPPAWRRLEPRKPLTGNTVGTNTVIGGINAFNLMAAATAPVFIFPRLGLGGPAAEIALIWVPVAFSTMFFAVPAVRWLAVARENGRRAVTNVRKMLMGLISKVSLGGEAPEPLSEPEARTTVASALPGKAHARVDLRSVLDRFVAEFDGEVEPGASGTLLYSFPGFRRQVAAAHRARHELALERQQVGQIVYSSADDPAEQGRRDLDAFDRELAGGAPGLEAPEREEETAAADEDVEAGRRAEPLALPPPDDLSAYVLDPTRFDFRDERELAALESEMKARAPGARR